MLGARPFVPPATLPIPVVLRIPLGWFDDPLPAIAARSIASAITARKSLLTKPSISVLPVDPSND